MGNQIGLVQVWLGEFPEYFEYHLKTCENQQNIDFSHKKGNVVYDSYLDKIPYNEFRLYTLDYETSENDFENVALTYYGLKGLAAAAAGATRDCA